MHYFHIVATAGHDRPVFSDDSVVADVYSGFSTVTEAGAEIAAYAFMSAHLHWLLGVSELCDLPAVVARIIGPAARALNQRMGQRGSIFRPTYWRSPVTTEAYFWILPLYIHANPSPNATDARRLDIGLRSSHSIWSGTRQADWCRRGPAFEQYAGRYDDALDAYLSQRSECADHPGLLDTAVATSVLAVARVTGVSPSTLFKSQRGGKRDRMLLAWVLVGESGAASAGRVLGVDRETASRWARAVQTDPSFDRDRRLLGG